MAYYLPVHLSEFESAAEPDSDKATSGASSDCAASSSLLSQSELKPESFLGYRSKKRTYDGGCSSDSDGDDCYDYKSRAKKMAHEGNCLSGLKCDLRDSCKSRAKKRFYDREDLSDLDSDCDSKSSKRVCGEVNLLSNFDSESKSEKPSNEDSESLSDILSKLFVEGDDCYPISYSALMALSPEEEYDERGFNSEGVHRNRSMYDDAGYSIYGYNRNGYNRDGFDRDGYDEKGYNKDGFDRAGFYTTGSIYDAEGYDSHGFHKSGLHRNGSRYDDDGYNIYGFNEYGSNQFGDYS
ncbi:MULTISPECIES: hypothetical protein [Candidatus Ichthyocystis]|uniref:Uncharacterized protein n=1 Tax=Candidatus Ichthyocystis hellenicum TaxID=1561003 RepID=A0A0S4M5C9_9BURK|nr:MULTISPECIES: hypothetical protein [Ichthyocystis]CUT17930.1 hypothetical protein Ark11_1117 [Candidatus Ichthyocystis hellenicum]